eukprot:3252633-Prymnesium_polylepis.1
MALARAAALEWYLIEQRCAQSITKVSPHLLLVDHRRLEEGALIAGLADTTQPSSSPAASSVCPFEGHIFIPHREALFGEGKGAGITVRRLIWGILEQQELGEQDSLERVAHVVDEL